MSSPVLRMCSMKLKNCSLGEHIRWTKNRYNLRSFRCTPSRFLEAEKLADSEESSKADNIIDKIVYNSKIKSLRPLDDKIERYLKDQEIQKNYENQGPPVIALKYLMNNDSLEDYSSKNKEVENNGDKVQFPYGTHDTVSIDSSNIDLTYDAYDDEAGDSNNMPFNRLKDLPCKLPKKKWMKDYDNYSEVRIKHRKKDKEESDDEDSVNVRFNYGTADPSLPPSSVPCGGCGAHLHCQDISIPGFLPKEIFSGQSASQLQSLVCQRCHFLREYNTALSVSVNPDLYPEMISHIRGQKALVILVVDMTDFPCSIWPGISEIIGPKRPLIVVGNKVDLLQDWSRGWLDRAKRALVSAIPPRLNVIHTTLVSAKTNYGVEDLITALWKRWEYRDPETVEWSEEEALLFTQAKLPVIWDPKHLQSFKYKLKICTERGDVYLVGCTNVGKSTLFNSLLQSDYCKTKAVDLIQRATTSPWPGTTLNLLKFPIMRPEGWRLASRSLRLRTENPESIQKGEPTPQIITSIQRTFAHGLTDQKSDDYWDDPFALPKLSTLRRIRSEGSGLDPKDPVFAQSKWLYDTPGVITPDQIIDLLTTEELLTTLPQKPLVPRTYQLWPEHSIWIGGLGRLDFLEGPANIKVTVLAADTLPITICPVRYCEEAYARLLGTLALGVPRGPSARLRLWPGLEAAPAFSIRGDGWPRSVADVVLSSAGWIAVTAQKDSINRLQAWTPNARGIHVRTPPVLPRAIAVKGARLFKSPAYAIFNDEIKARR